MIKPGMYECRNKNGLILKLMSASDAIVNYENKNYIFYKGKKQL
jgi:hypothetical protein